MVIILAWSISISQAYYWMVVHKSDAKMQIRIVSLSIIQIYLSMVVHESNMEIQIWIVILHNQSVDFYELSIIIAHSYPMTSSVCIYIEKYS